MIPDRYLFEEPVGSTTRVPERSGRVCTTTHTRSGGSSADLETWLKRERDGNCDPPPSVVGPPLGGHVDRLREAIADLFNEQRRSVVAAIERDMTDGLARVLEQVSFRMPLTGTLMDANRDAIAAVAAREASRLERRLAKIASADTAIKLTYEVGGCFAIEHMRQTTVQTAVVVENVVRSEIVDVLDGSRGDEAIHAISELFDRLSEGYAIALAYSETRSAARFASQALAESIDVIDGKRWVHTDACPCPSHAMLDGETIPVEEHFIVRPTDDEPFDHPVSTSVVGNDRPIECRCFQRAVLRDGLPAEPAELAAFESVSVTIDGEPVEALTPRKIELKHEHARDGETFLEMFDRTLGTHSISAAARTLGTSKKTIYKWGDLFAADLQNYSSR